MQGTTRGKKKTSSAPGSGRKAGSAPGGGRGNLSVGGGDRPATRVTSGVGRGRVKKRPPSSGPIYQVKPRCTAHGPRQLGQAQLKDSAPADRPNLMIQKLRFCMKWCGSTHSRPPNSAWGSYDFSDDSVEEKSARDAKKVKQMILMEICDYINAKPQILTQEAVVSHLIEMVSCNLFSGQRAFVASEPSEEEEPLLDPAYVHTQLVYEILLRFVMNGDTESGMMRRYVNLEFIDKLVRRPVPAVAMDGQLSAFNTEDPREREYLKTILHRIYGRFMTFRLQIRKAINNIFYEFTYQDDKHAGIGELLEILGSIINGFALPLKDEHKSFLAKYLLPLYKPRGMLNYHPQLCYCIVQFVEKDPSLSAVIIQSLLRCAADCCHRRAPGRWWPHSNSQKEVAFLNEVEEVFWLVGNLARAWAQVVESTHNPEQNLLDVVKLIFKRIAKCILCNNFQVAERALFLWQSPQFLEFSRSNLNACLPILFPALCPETEHWNPSVQQLSAGVLEFFQQVDPAKLEAVREQNEKDKVESKAAAQRRKEQWQKIEQMAQMATATKGLEQVKINDET